jgi:hypothetical protein
MTAEESVSLLWEEAFRPILNYLTFGIDIAAGVVIAISIIRGFIKYIKTIRRSLLEQTKEEDVKRYVGNGLILALDPIFIFLKFPAILCFNNQIKRKKE